MRLNICFSGIALLSVPLLIKAAVPCNSTHNPCKELLRDGSQCRDGFCTNPFQGGCLRSFLNDDRDPEKYSNAVPRERGESLLLSRVFRRVLSSRRVCNSQDATDVAERQLCKENDNYSEVRIWPQNWESAVVQSWILQIIFSEILGVPASLESGEAGVNMNFYNENYTMQFGKSNEYEMFQNAYNARGGDCTEYSKNQNGSEGYVPCAHVVPELWFPTKELMQQRESGVAEPAQRTSIIGFSGWYITKFSVKKDPSLGTYFGLQGKMNRRKLAETFKRPMTWKDYCDLISRTNCTIPDNTAKRAPADDSEDGQYFNSGIYTGYFRATDKNDCNRTELCTGHIIDYPCGWTSFVKPQTRHLDIALESDGGEGSFGAYTSSEIAQIWHAANATKSNIIGVWFQPDATHTAFMGSDAEMTPVILPPPTQECIGKKVDVSKRCDENATEFEIYGDKEGACGDPPVILQKAVVGNMLSNIKENESRRARMSPAYDVFEDFSLTQLQLGQILAESAKRGKDLRYVSCKWIVDNMEHVLRVMPKTHPRTFESATTMTPVAYIAHLLSAIAIIITSATWFGIAYKQRSGEGVDKISQIEFILVLLTGLSLVSIGSLLLALRPDNIICILPIWMINIGYTLQLVPLLVKVSAILRIVQASKKMKRVVLNIKQLFVKSLGLSAIAVVYCFVWTFFDPPKKQEELQLTNKTNHLGEAIVTVTCYCDSESNVWYLFSFLWQSLLLVCASILAYQMRSAPNRVNDSTELAFMIYSSFLFLVLRIVVYFLAGTLSEGSITNFVLAITRSIFCSVDTITNICIYFPKVFRSKKKRFPHRRLDALHRSIENNVSKRFGGKPLRRRHPKNPKNEEEEKVEEATPILLKDYCKHCHKPLTRHRCVTDPC